MSNVTVRLFARARDLAGRERVELGLAEQGARVVDLRRMLTELYPELGEFLDRCLVAINGEFADDFAVVPDGSEVAVLPPVSGG